MRINVSRFETDAGPDLVLNTDNESGIIRVLPVILKDNRRWAAVSNGRQVTADESHQALCTSR